ncbi:hypothetical protein D3C86_1931520 [compost metagenome]
MDGLIDFRRQCIRIFRGPAHDLERADHVSGHDPVGPIGVLVERQIALTDPAMNGRAFRAAEVVDQSPGEGGMLQECQSFGHALFSGAIVVTLSRPQATSGPGC